GVVTTGAESSVTTGSERTSLSSAGAVLLQAVTVATTAQRNLMRRCTTPPKGWSKSRWNIETLKDAILTRSRDDRFRASRGPAMPTSPQTWNYLESLQYRSRAKSPKDGIRGMMRR